MFFRSRFLGSTAPQGSRTEEEWFRRLRVDEEMVRLAILTLRELVGGQRLRVSSTEGSITGSTCGSTCGSVGQGSPVYPEWVGL